MKTSLEIDDRLYTAARLRAARDHTTVRALVEQGLATVLGIKPAPATGSDTLRDLADLEALCAQISALPLLTSHTPDEILGYGDDGGFA